MDSDLKCPECGSGDSYFDGNFQVCPACFHEWNPDSIVLPQETVDSSVRDSNGTVLQDGDSVSVIKDLKVKGSSSVVKVGTKVKNIRLVESSDGHNIDCRIEGFGAMKLKSEFVKKV